MVFTERWSLAGYRIGFSFQDFYSALLITLSLTGTIAGQLISKGAHMNSYINKWSNYDQPVYCIV